MIRVVSLCLLCAASAHAAMTGLAAEALRLSIDRPHDVGVVRIRCRNGAAMRYFRGAVIETGRAAGSWDVVLTALHGLPNDTEVVRGNCVVVGADGSQTGIRRLWRPVLRGRVSGSDWAVMLTQTRIGGSLQRLSIRSDLRPDFIERSADGLSVRLPLLTPAAERACSLTRSSPTEAAARSVLFAHTCRAWPGHSGSPILVTDTGRTFILGIHLGRRRNFLDNTVIGIGRMIDATIATAIDAARAEGFAAGAAARPDEPPPRRSHRRSAVTL